MRILKKLNSTNLKCTPSHGWTPLFGSFILSTKTYTVEHDEQVEYKICMWCKKNIPDVDNFLTIILNIWFQFKKLIIRKDSCGWIQ